VSPTSRVPTRYSALEIAQSPDADSDANKSQARRTARRLNVDEEAFASWFVDWWRRRGQHLGLGPSDTFAAEGRSPSTSEIEIWREEPHLDKGRMGSRD
jgi:hypothetical protein